MPFTFTKSYRTYLKDPAARSAVDYILGSKKPEVPADLEWDRLRDFHAAVLAAHQVRCEYAIGLCGLWERVWQPGLDNCDFTDSLAPLSFNESQVLDCYPSDTYSLWEGVLERVYDKDGYRLSLGVSSDLRHAWLTLWLLNREGENLTTSLVQGGDWRLGEHGYLYTREKLAPITDDGIELVPLNRVAGWALQEIGRILGLPEDR